MNPAIKCSLISLVMLCAQSNLLAQEPPSAAETNPADQQQDTDYLLQQESELQQELMNLDNGGPYSVQAAEILSELARIQQELGNDEESTSLYNELLLNIRINQGLYSVEQLPVIMDLLEANLALGEYAIADELGDWAELIYERTFSDEQDLDNLIEGFDELIALRLTASKDHECFSLNLRIENYDNRDFTCTEVRRDRAEHFIAAYEMQEKTVEFLKNRSDESGLAVLRQTARLAKLAIIAAGAVDGIVIIDQPPQEILDPYRLLEHERPGTRPNRYSDTGGYDGSINPAPTNYYFAERPDPGLRRRYDPEFYYNTSFRLIRQLEQDFSTLMPD